MNGKVLGLILVGIVPFAYANAFEDRVADPGVDDTIEIHKVKPGGPYYGNPPLPRYPKSPMPTLPHKPHRPGKPYPGGGYMEDDIQPGGPLYDGDSADTLGTDGAKAWANVKSILIQQFESRRFSPSKRAEILRHCGNNAYDAGSCLKRVGYCEIPKRLTSPEKLPVGAVVTYDQRPAGNVFVKSSKYTWTSTKTYSGLPRAKPWSRLMGIYAPCDRRLR